MLVSGVKLASCADSSSGMLTDVIMRAFELIDLSTQTIAKLDAAMRKHALSLIIKEAKKKRLTAGTRGAMNYWKRLFVCVMRSWQQNWKSFWIYS